MIEENDKPRSNLVEDYLKDVERARFFRKKDERGSFDWYVDFYGRRAGRMMFWFRLFGVVVIVLSASIPFLAAFEQHLPGGTMLVALVAVLIATATGINAFFRWDMGWQGYISTKLALLQLRSQWELEIAQAKVSPDMNKGLGQAQRATESFLRQASALIAEETKTYFSVQRLPEAQGDKAQVQ